MRLTQGCKITVDTREKFRSAVSQKDGRDNVILKNLEKKRPGISSALSNSISGATPNSI